jgi:hypothetical protein
VLSKPKLYRHENGQLLPTKPPPNPYTVRIGGGGGGGGGALTACGSGQQSSSALIFSVSEQVAKRRQWADLVRYARTTGGDKECTEGTSFRYGVGVSYAEHEAYLKSIGLEMETDAAGNWFGFDTSKTDPLADPEHALNQTLDGRPLWR